MKRTHKLKSKGQSKSKQAKKELVAHLVTAFENAIITFGQAKKTKKIVEKFAKRIAKKVVVKTETLILTEEKPITPVKKPVKTSKAPVSKVRTAAKPVVETADK